MTFVQGVTVPFERPLAGTTPEDIRPVHCVGSGAAFIAYLGQTYAGYIQLGTLPTGACFVFVDPATITQQRDIRADQFPRVLNINLTASESPWPDHIVQLRRDLGLSVGACAEALDVSRQTYYDWLSGEIPNRNNQARIGALAAIATEWANMGMGPLSRYWSLSSPKTFQSFRQFFGSSDLSVEEFRRVVTQMGLGKRLLPFRASSPRLIKKSRLQNGRNIGPRSWHTNIRDRE